MKRWLDPLTKQPNYDECPPEFIKFFEKEWVDPDNRIALTEKGSMTKVVFVAYIKLFNKHARKIAADPAKALLLLLDSHKSRCRFDRIEEAKKHNIEVFQTSANTSN